ncbi:hypothetical protein AK812_SmicGene44381 [Symbiodinium microadriaticum]|uniref:Uncharacterized protein n=1 Tax=Symbiodinium microadriaticum TaxID=2951 RepID=A0A1Q9BYL7_SYMMI|nr:hypothetical protein AK812_SmicGene44381 [Symbiodinium microadriaticum]
MVDVSDVSVAYDRIFNFVVFRHHLIHFYLPCPEMRHEGKAGAKMLVRAQYRCEGEACGASEAELPAGAAPVPAVPKVTLTGAEAQLAKNVDEQFLKDLMSADILYILSQLDIQLEGRSAVDHIPKGLSTLSQFLLYRQQLLENPYPDQWVMAPWQALRTNAGRASLIRKYQQAYQQEEGPKPFKASPPLPLQMDL